MQNFYIVEHGMDIEECALKLHHKDDKVSEDERVVMQARDVMLGTGHLKV